MRALLTKLSQSSLQRTQQTSSWQKVARAMNSNTTFIYCSTGSSNIPLSQSSCSIGHNNHFGRANTTTTTTTKSLSMTSSSTASFATTTTPPTSMSSTTSNQKQDSTTTTKAEAKDDNDNNKDEKDKDKKKGEDSYGNIFLDHLGKIFLAIIGSIIATLIRSSFNTSNRTNLRDLIEELASIDPVEIDDLRIANSELKPDTFRIIMKDIYTQFSTGTCSYNDFVISVRKTMRNLKGDAFTIELGHLLDRVVINVLDKYNKSPDDIDIPITLWFTILSLALNSTPSERIEILFEVLDNERNEIGSATGDQYQSSFYDHSNESNTIDTTTATTTNNDDMNLVSIQQIRKLVGYLQDTCQLVPDSQIVPIENQKYPTQQWQVGKPNDLVPWEGPETEKVDLDAFALILRSKSVCAWGECYHRRKFGNK